MTDYRQTLTRVETYFDQTATRAWEALTSDAPVSKVRQTVRAGRDRMRQVMLGCLPTDLRGARILDAGCGTGMMTQELARRGAHVTAIDISPSLVGIAQRRLPESLSRHVTFLSGDMLKEDLGRFDHVMAMDSLIYYTAADIGAALARLGPRTSGSIVFTVAPRTAFLMTFWGLGKLFPRSDRSPVMIPHAPETLASAARDAGAPGHLRVVERVTAGFYISQAMELRT